MHPVIALLLVLGSSLIFTGCEERGFNIKAPVSGSSNSSGSGGSGGSSLENHYRSSVNLKSGQELHQTFAKLTGVSPEQGATLGSNFPGGDVQSNNPVNVASIFSRVRPLLMINNELAGLSEFKQLAVMKLAAGFCHQVACNAAGASPGASPAYLPNVSATTLNLAYGNEALREAFASSLLNQIWGPAEQQELANRNEAIQDVADYVSELIQNPAVIPSCTNTTVGNNQENLKVRSVAKAACTLVLSSLPVTRF
jgi:hypothetical protein